MTIRSLPIARSAPTRRYLGVLALATACMLGTWCEAGAQTVEPAARIAAIYKQYQGKGDPKLSRDIYAGARDAK